MIKRRFYKFEHGDKDAASESSSSSSSDSEAEEEEATEETEGEEDFGEGDVVTQEKDRDESSSSSGYESEDSSVHEVNLDSSGAPTSDDDIGTRNDRNKDAKQHASSKGDSKSIPVQNRSLPEDGIPSEVADRVLKCKSVFKCRLCPRIVCLTEETIKSHLKSKRHARSEKLLKEGRLKLMLNDNGEIEEEILPEKPDPNITSAEISSTYSKKNKGRQRQRMRLKKKKESLENAEDIPKNQSKKRRKTATDK